jgi:RNA recognition motif-containing protein
LSAAKQKENGNAARESYNTAMGKKVYIGNLGPGADKTSLTKLFSMFGTVEDAYIVTDRQTGKSKGFGFVVMAAEEHAKAAIEALNGKQCGDYTVIVSEAKGS